MSTHLIPGADFEIGLSPRTQFSIDMPLIVQNPDQEPGTVGGGHIETELRYLFAGGHFNSYAFSLNPFVAPPTGDRGLAGDATEAGASLNFDKGFRESIFFHGNYGWSTTIGGSEPRERMFFYRSAMVWEATFHWAPVFEVLGQTDTATGTTALSLQPEVIYHLNDYWELKLGVPVAMTHSSPDIGVRVQIMWGFGRRGTK